MLKLNKNLFEKAKNFIKKEARLIDRALYEFYFEDGNREDLLNELEKYQNLDGGFGHGLEPDFTVKSSTPIATTIAFQYMRIIELSPENEIVKNGIKYLLKSYDIKNARWRRVVEEMSNAPHAPWWRYRGDKEGTWGKSIC